MTDKTPTGRRRGAALEEAILAAAVEEFTENGYPGMTMDRVAKRAGTNKNAIYRRWPGRAALGIAAYRRMVERELRPPDTGDLRDDVLAVLRKMNGDLSAPGGDLLRGLLAGAATEPELLPQLHELITTSGAEPWLTILGRAVARGDIKPEALHPRVATVAITLLRNEYVTRGLASVPDAVLVDIVDEVYLPLLSARGAINP
ncbi:TetR family transcriptional regulator [Prauserella marina]|uniref:DNA-binding transcriptional regulator, AcrR family n=1 Tax=Prauserella marina TaxID=530584 RepID=A0A222W0D9_9PSEU|nr:TetR/AcrR family transcriptional regulator [Prauserella marina]ASR39610.1 TetR family transcriptional regulator [Prauserella marina]PWV75505.1 TetR family transcriptional regulator [Prauserella marina]SDD33065.1 DNA-binding transcriptional regulator, AcrR family [Prauserella marina]